MKSKYYAAKSLMLEKLGGDPDRVLDEARIVSQLDSPSIIKITDCGFMDQKSKERPYIVMEFFDGADLFDVIEKQGALPLEDALHIMLQAAKGLQAAHAKGVLHRDVKPHNLLVRKENTTENGPQWAVKLIDFGLAMQQKVSDVSTVAQLKTGSTMSGNLIDNSIAGTMEYAAPEQMGRRPEKVGKYSDAFGWAKMCCYTLFKTTQPLRTHWKNIPEDIADLLERCLTEDPNKRPNDFSEIISVLINYNKKNTIITENNKNIPNSKVNLTNATNESPEIDQQIYHGIEFKNLQSLLNCAIKSISFTSFKFFGNPDYTKVAKESDGSYIFPCTSGSQQSTQVLIADEIISQFTTNRSLMENPIIKKTLSKISNLCGDQSVNNRITLGLRILFGISIYCFFIGFIFWDMLGCMVNRFKLKTRLLEILSAYEN